MNEKIISMLNKFSKSKGLSIITNDDCEYIAKNDNYILEVYYYKYTDEIYDIEFRGSNNNIELYSICEGRLIDKIGGIENECNKPRN